MPFFSPPPPPPPMHSGVPSTLSHASRVASSQVNQQLQFQVPTYSQSDLPSPQEKQQSQPVYPWSAHAPPFGQSPLPFLRDGHTLSTSGATASELLLFGGYVHSTESPSNDLYEISTQDFFTTLLQTSGDVPGPRFAHDAVLTSTALLIWGGWTDFDDQNAHTQGHDDSLYLLNLGTSDLFLMPRPAPAYQIFLRSSIARVDLHRRRWSWARRSLPPHHDVGRFQALRFRWH